MRLEREWIMMFANKVNFFGKQSVIRIYKNISTFCNIMTFFTLTLLCVLSHYTVEIFSRIDKNKLPIWIQEVWIIVYSIYQEEAVILYISMYTGNINFLLQIINLSRSILSERDRHRNKKPLIFFLVIRSEDKQA